MPRTFECPTRDDLPLPPAWWVPLEGVARAVTTDTRYELFDVGDFKLMARVIRPPRPRLTLYKHRYTRRYLNLDDAGHAYRFIETTAGDELGRYIRHRDLTAALDHLALWELPWMKPGLEALQRGCSWDRRWLARVRADGTAPIDDVHVHVPAFPGDHCVG